VKCVSKNSAKVVYNRFETDFSAVVEHLEVEATSTLEKEKGFEFMQLMGFFKQVATQSEM